MANNKVLTFKRVSGAHCGLGASEKQLLCEYAACDASRVGGHFRKIVYLSNVTLNPKLPSHIFSCTLIKEIRLGGILSINATF